MYESAIDKIRAAGGNVVYPVSLVHPSTLEFQGESGFLTILCKSASLFRPYNSTQI